MVHYTSQHIYTITELSPDVITILHEYHITNMRKCENTRDIHIYERYKRELTYMYTKKYKYEKYKRALTSLLRENSRGTKGV